MKTSLDNPRRVFIVVIDAFGVGGLPDAPEYGDSVDANTLGGIDREASALNLPTLEKLGLGHLGTFKQVKAVENPIGSYGKMNEYSKGKDTTTGHWEMAGIYLDTPFPTYPDGFPPEVMNEFLEKAGCESFLGNKPASGTEILKELGMKHLETGYPIVYTSADSVFQIAAHVGPESKVDLETLYRWGQAARDLLTAEHEVSRVIVRPFVGDSPDNFVRVGEQRKDYALSPPEKSTLVRVKEQGGLVMGVGKIEDIFNFDGLTHTNHTGSNPAGLDFTEALIKQSDDWNQYDMNGKSLADYPHPEKQLVFVNLVETDSVYGHRRDVEGYARALEKIDVVLERIVSSMNDNDLLMISADHGCDPTAPGTDHTREYVPILMYSPSLPAKDLMIRDSFADIGQTTIDWLGFDVDGQRGQSMLEGLTEKQPTPA